MNPEQDIAHDRNRLQIVDLAILSAWKAPWNKAWGLIGVLKKRWNGDEIRTMVAEEAKRFEGKAAIYCPNPGWLTDLLAKTKPDMNHFFSFSDTFTHLSDGFLSYTRAKETPENAYFLEALYKEGIDAISRYEPEQLVAGARDSYIRQREMLLSCLKTPLWSLLARAGRTEESLAIQMTETLGLTKLVEHMVETLSNHPDMLALAGPNVGQNLCAQESETDLSDVDESKNRP